MKKNLTLLFLLVSFICFAQTEKYARVKIYADEIGLANLAKAGISFDHGYMQKGVFFISDFSESEIALLKAKGYRYDILIGDVKQYYRDRNDPNSVHYVSEVPVSRSLSCVKSKDVTTPSNFILGSMGGFFTYDEIIWHLDNIATLYPNIVKSKQALALNTAEGRPMYWMKISDNPTVDEHEPEVFYNSLHHAREPASVSQLIMYMYYLCENYSTNPEVKYLVDNEEMYFIPVVNPDGYVYNQTTDPLGGGLWRKNRVDNGDGTNGVDLNRNYGTNWGLDDEGSSPYTYAGNYRGTGPFSEAETKNIRDFCGERQFQLLLNYHTYGNLLIYPLEHTNYDDSLLFMNYASRLTTYNKYAFGTDMQTVHYTTNGSSNEWMYLGQGAKPKILAMTPEIGSRDDGFWPAKNKIIDLCKENIWPNLQFAHLVLKQAIVTDEQPNYISTKNGFMHYKIKRFGLADSGVYVVSITPISNSIISVGQSKTYSSLALLQEVDDSIAYSLGTVESGELIKYALSVSNGLYTYTDTIAKRFGDVSVEFSSDGNSMTGWSSNSWDVTSVIGHNSLTSITDSPFGDYPEDEESMISMVNEADFTDAIAAQVVFYAKWDLETNFDYVQPVVSTDNGISWIPVCGQYTKLGNGNQDSLKPLYDAYKFDWVKEQIPLDDYVGQKIKFGFRLVSDRRTTGDGFYFDNLKVEKLMPSTQGVIESDQNKIYISQNTPNPTADYTYINYRLPVGTPSAIINLFNSFGQLVLQEKLSASSGNIMLNTSVLAQGIYYYTVESGGLYSKAFKLSVVR